MKSTRRFAHAPWLIAAVGVLAPALDACRGSLSSSSSAATTVPGHRQLDMLPAVTVG